jgi:Domain of unknown function (DUF4145)
MYLCAYLGKGDVLNDAVKKLISEGLDPAIADALDVVRVIGNSAVHPGKIDMKDNRETAVKLFDMVNLLAEQMISMKKRIAQLKGSLPQTDQDKITNRNAGVLAASKGKSADATGKA